MWILYFNGLYGFRSQDVTAASLNAASVSNVINLSLSLSRATLTVMQHPSKFHIEANYTHLCSSFLASFPPLCISQSCHFSLSFKQLWVQSWELAAILIQESRFFRVLHFCDKKFLMGFFFCKLGKSIS